MVKIHRRLYEPLERKGTAQRFSVPHLDVVKTWKKLAIPENVSVCFFSGKNEISRDVPNYLY